MRFEPKARAGDVSVRMLRAKLLRRIAGAACAVAVFGAAATAAADPKDAIPGKRAAAIAAQARIDALNNQLEPAIEAYNQATAQLGQVQARIRENKKQIAVVKSNIAKSRADLGQKLALAFRQGEPDVVAAILAAGSLDSMLNSVDLVNRSSNQMTAQIVELRSSRQDLQRREKALEGDQRTAARLQGQRAAEKQRIVGGLAQASAMKRGLESEIASLQTEQNALDRKRAADAAAQLKAAQEAAANASANDPGLGGSGDSGGGGPTIPVPPADGSIGSRVIAAAMSYLGVPYVWGGASRGGVDCSGLTMLAYQSVGIGLDHFTGSQWNSGAHVGIGQLAPGDLVFFYPDHHHVGIYIGGGMFIHAPHTGDHVRVTTLAAHGSFSGGVRPY